MKHRLTRWSIERPKTTLALLLLISVGLASGLTRIQIDTDPEHMLAADTPVRVELDRIETRFGIKDIMVLGLARKPGSLFTQQGLNEVYEITNRILELPGIDTGDRFQSLNTVDNVRLDDEGTMVVRAFLLKPVEGDDEARSIRNQLESNRLMNQQLISNNSAMIAVYIPIENKDDAAGLYAAIMGDGQQAGIIEEVAPGAYEAHLAGVPVAQSIFGQQMFAQMAVLAPLVGLIIFIGLWFIFRKPSLILAPLGVAMISVSWTMGLMVWMGFPVHIMSSMSPVFLMTIGVGDGIHLLSQFYDTYPEYKDRKSAVLGMMDHLAKPVLFTSITTSIGFASLAMVDIPPVRVFGLFVAFGVMAAWFLTITFVPALIMMVRNLPASEMEAYEEEEKKTLLNEMLGAFGRAAERRSGWVLGGAILLTLFGAAGIYRLEVNDNPVKWFKASSDIRQANDILNEKFGGTYLSYIEVDAGEKDGIKDPAVLNYMQSLQEHLEAAPTVGKTTSLADIVRRVHRVIIDDKPTSEIIPDDKLMVGELIFAFQSSGAGPESLINLADNDFAAANIWLQMKSGDNKEMAAIEKRFDTYVASNPPPSGVKLTLSGPNYLNMIWQRFMVNGMLKALIGSFAIVLILLIVQFRSIFWGVMGILPLGLTIILSYGLLGWAGRNYDMPVAVLSALTLGMAIDFAIHFIQRFRDRLNETNDLQEALDFTMGEPARAIMRNAFILLIGFSVMWLADLVPYLTVGFFMSMIMLLSSLVTVALLPALIIVFRGVIVRNAAASKTQPETSAA